MKIKINELKKIIQKSLKQINEDSPYGRFEDSEYKNRMKRQKKSGGYSKKHFSATLKNNSLFYDYLKKNSSLYEIYSELARTSVMVDNDVGHTRYKRELHHLNLHKKSPPWFGKDEKPTARLLNYIAQDLEFKEVIFDKLKEELFDDIRWKKQQPGSINGGLYFIQYYLDYQRGDGNLAFSALCREYLKIDKSIFFVKDYRARKRMRAKIKRAIMKASAGAKIGSIYQYMKSVIMCDPGLVKMQNALRDYAKNQPDLMEEIEENIFKLKPNDIDSYIKEGFIFDLSHCNLKEKEKIEIEDIEIAEPDPSEDLRKRKGSLGG